MSRSVFLVAPRCDREGVVVQEGGAGRQEGKDEGRLLMSKLVVSPVSLALFFSLVAVASSLLLVSCSSALLHSRRHYWMGRGRGRGRKGNGRQRRTRRWRRSRKQGRRRRRSPRQRQRQRQD